MRKDQTRRHDAQVRVNGVCAQHSALFDATPGGQSTRAALGTYVADVSRLLAVQKQSVEEQRAATKQCRVARRAVHAAVKGVVKVGQLVTVDQTTGRGCSTACRRLPTRSSRRGCRLTS